jgi:histidine triad (HIT) family protein
MLAGEIPTDSLHDDDLVFAIRDINPRAPVHVLVISKRHIDSVRELDYDQSMLLAHVVGVGNDLAAELGIADRGYRLTFNIGDEGGQSIHHLHMHLLGGRHLGPEA